MGKKLVFSSINSSSLLLALAAIGILIFVLLTQFPFLKKDFSLLYQKNESEAIGNQTPAGPYFNLNITGIPENRDFSVSNAETQRIFVPLEGTCKIKLNMGEYSVTDGSCKDGSASFQLPFPDSDKDGITTYSVWARAVGKPGGKSETVPCAIYLNSQTGFKEEWCSTSQMIALKGQGKSDFEDISKLLLYLYLDLNGDGTLERYSLFDPTLQDFLWNYNNEGLKDLQLRFYESVLNLK